jgi:hypothetical protein
MNQPMRSIVRAAVAGLGPWLAMAVIGCTPAAPAAEQADPMADGAQNVRLVGYNDLQGRQSLQLTTRSDAANGNWAYVGHQPNDRPDSEEPQLNPITGQAEINGTSIIDITDPARPTTKWHIPGISRANHRHVGVVYDYQHDSSGRDYLVRSSDTGQDFRFQIFDITDRATNPQAITLVSEITGTPPNSCGPGCGGKFITRAHKGFWSEESGYYYTASGEPGFRNTLLHIWDLRDPATPKFVGRTWLPGMKDTEDKALYQGQYVHIRSSTRPTTGCTSASGTPAGRWAPGTFPIGRTRNWCGLSIPSRRTAGRTRSRRSSTTSCRTSTAMRCRGPTSS